MALQLEAQQACRFRFQGRVNESIEQGVFLVMAVSRHAPLYARTDSGACTAADRRLSVKI
jgi:hypothetical protein